MTQDRNTTLGQVGIHHLITYNEPRHYILLPLLHLEDASGGQSLSGQPSPWSGMCTARYPPEGDSEDLLPILSTSSLCLHRTISQLINEATHSDFRDLRLSMVALRWCSGWDLNPQILDPKSSAYANSATRASGDFWSMDIPNHVLSLTELDQHQ